MQQAEVTPQHNLPAGLAGKADPCLEVLVIVSWPEPAAALLHLHTVQQRHPRSAKSVSQQRAFDHAHRSLLFARMQLVYKRRREAQAAEGV